MRTTLDLPDELLKQAKIAAVRRGSSLRDLVSAALRAELLGAGGKTRQRLQTAPIQLAADSPLRGLAPEDLKCIDNEDEAERLLAVYRRR